MTILLISTMILWTLTDYLNYLKLGEWYKISLGALVLSAIWVGTVSTMPIGRLIIALCLLHFPIHQVSNGLLRTGKPLYLGSGIFDRIVYFLCGGSWWFYLLILLASMYVGLDLFS